MKDKAGLRKIAMQIDDGLWRRARMKAIEEGIELRQLVAQAVEARISRGVGHQTWGESAKVHKRKEK
jgi:hypothetical protein